MITSSQINEILDITESFQLHGALKGTLFDKDKRLKIFKRFLEIEKYKKIKEYLNTHNLQETVFWIFVCSFYCLFKRVPLKMYLWHTCVLWVFKKEYHLDNMFASGR